MKNEVIQMEMIGIYDFVFFIPKRNPAYVKENLLAEGSKFQEGKALCLASEYTLSKHAQLRDVLGTTLELLLYSDTAKALIEHEDWSIEFVDFSSNKIKDTIVHMSAKDTHQFNVSSRPLHFLLLVFLSYNALYTRSAKNSKYNYASPLADFKRIMGFNEAGQNVKESTIDQSVDEMIAEYCLYCTFKGTINKIRKIKELGNMSFKDLMEYIEEGLRFYHERIIFSTVLVKSEDTETDLDIIYNSNISNGGVRQRRHRAFKSLLEELADEDLDIMEAVVDELFKLKPGESLKNKAEQDMKIVAARSQEAYQEAVERKIADETDPTLVMFQQVDKSERKLIEEIHKKFPM
jgi:hypothetical protein